MEIGDLLHEIVSMPHVESFTLRWDAEKHLYTWEAQVRGERYATAVEVLSPQDLKLQARTILLNARHTLRMLAVPLCSVPHPKRPGIYCTAPLGHRGDDHHGLSVGSDWPNLAEREGG